MRDSYTQISVDHFINNMTGEEFRVGDEISYEPHCSRGDGRRIFTLHGFQISDNIGKGYTPHPENNGKVFEFIYAELDKGCASGTHMDNVFVTRDVNPIFRQYPSNEWERRALQNDWTAYKKSLRESKHFAKRNYLLLI